MKKIALGILAHVDSGKTTLSESILYRAGEIRKLGRVDHKDAFLDTHILEKDRGITIFSKQAVINLKNTTITLLDTPGHIDFSAEMERTLQVLDYAVLIISGTDGVQSHTKTLWKLLNKHKIPTFIFVNKMDLQVKSKSEILSHLKNQLDENCIDFSIQNSQDFYESIAVCDENILNGYMKNLSVDDNLIADAIKQRNIFPCFFGSALKLDGIDLFLEAIDKYTVSKKYCDKFSAKIFKISRDEQGNRLTHLKITGGVLKVKEAILYCDNQGNELSEKINQIRVYSGAKFQAIEEATSGTICAVTGLSKTFAGQGIGLEAKSSDFILEPVLTYKVTICDQTNVFTAYSNLKILEEEDPTLNIIWNEHLQEIHLQLMGEVQLEILKSIIMQRFNMNVDFGKENIVYKETISNIVEGVGHYEPLRHYAEVHLLIEPLPNGSGVKVNSSCPEDELDKNWQRLVLSHLQEKQHLGVLTGFPITDIKVTLIAGKAHIKHTEGGDFRQATYRALRQGLMQASSVLLEPWYNFYLEVPYENIGRAISDLQFMNAEYNPPLTKDNFSVITGSVPVACIQDYQIKVANYTSGKGKISYTLKGYFPCHNSDEVIAQINYNADSDLENTADSVFCTHGAGFVVKWNKVYEYMHIESKLNKQLKKAEISKEKNIIARTASYCASLQEDKELLKIFENTYGPIKRDVYKAFDTEKSLATEYSAPNTKSFNAKTEYLLVDGYNVIFAWDDLNELAKKSLDDARNRLIHTLCNYQGVKQCNIILVFDAYKIKGNLGEIEKFHNITVVYTKEAETADMYIEKVTHDICKDNFVRVVTSDGLEQLIILGHGAFRVSALAFKEEVKQVENTIREFLKNK